jgi:hypothetical protein
VSNNFIIFGESPRATELFSVRVTGHAFFFHFFLVLSVVKEVEPHQERNVSSGSDEQVGSSGCKKRKSKSRKEHTGEGNLGDHDHRGQRMRTQLIDGNSQSDVTVQDLEELSRPPKRTKTAYFLGHCQNVCQDGAKLQGTTAVAFLVSKFVPPLKSRG